MLLLTSNYSHYLQSTFTAAGFDFRLTGCCNGETVATFRHIYSVVSYQRLYYHYYRISHQLIVKYINILWVVQYYCGGGGWRKTVFLLIFKLNVCCDCGKNLGHLLKLLAVLFFVCYSRMTKFNLRL